MKIAVLEHFTAQSGLATRDDRIAEGRAIRDAVVADLLRLPGAEVVVVERRRDLRAALRAVDAALVVAPEESGILEGLCRQVERSGRTLLGPSSGAVRLLADKLRTTRVLAAAGVPTPRTRVLSWVAARRELRDMTAPFVLKPRDGCGGQGVVLVRHAREIDAALVVVRRETRRDDVLAQEYVSGSSVSVSHIVSARTLALGLNRQRLRRGRTLAYLGGETFWPHARAREAVAAARAAVLALVGSVSGVRGYLGVDLVIGRSGPVVIEVNPRLTTSYVGLRLSMRENLASLIVDAVAGRALPARIIPLGRCRFRSDGATEIVAMTPRGQVRGPAVSAHSGNHRGRIAWRTISAGTSAASI
jgi:tyramine---L-glutamate ligase